MRVDRRVMRSVACVGLGITVLANAPAANAQENIKPTCTASLDAHVVSLDLHAPIANALISSAGEILGTTGPKGHLILRRLCAGSMELSIAADGYESKTQAVEIRAGRRTNVELELLNSATETVVIEGTRGRDVEMSSSTEITGEDLERTRGRSFGDALADVPGVSPLRSGSGLAKPIVRGQFGRRLLILVDSIRHRSQDWGLDHAPEIDPFIADSLTVVRGAAGVRYGPDAIGGAILVDPPALLTAPGAKMETHLITQPRRGGSIASRLQVGSSALPGVAYELGGSVSRLAPPSTPDYPLANTGSLEWSAGAAVGYRTNNAEYKLSLRHYEAIVGICACLRLESSDDFFEQLDSERPIDADLYTKSSIVRRAFQAVSHELALARGRWQLPDIGELSATYAYQFDHREEFDVVRVATGPQFDFRLESHDFELAFRHKVLHLDEHYHLTGSVGVTGLIQGHGFGGLPLIPDYNAKGIGLFAIERLLGHDFELEAGVRVDGLTRTADIERNDFLRLVRSGQLAEDECGGGQGDPVSCDSSFVTLAASIGGLYQFSRELSAKVELSSTSRPPNPDEQYLNGTSPTFPVLGLGKPDLGSETTYGGSITGAYRGTSLTLEASAYANYIDDYIYFAPALDADGNPIFDVLIRGSFPRFVTRPVNATFYGTDGGLAWKVLPELELGAQLSIVRAKNLTDDSFLVFIPADRARLSARTSKEDVLGLQSVYAEVATTLVARQNRFDQAADLSSPPDGYALLDAEVGLERSLGAQTIKFAIAGTNLTNARYRDYTSLLRYFADQPGWQLSLRLTLRASSNP